MSINTYHEITAEGSNIYLKKPNSNKKVLLGVLNVNDERYIEKLNAIKNVLCEDRFTEILDIIFDRLPPSARTTGTKIIGRLIKAFYNGGTENLEILADMIKNPAYITSESLSDEPVDIITVLANHYNFFAPEFFEELFKEQPGDMGPSELMFSCFTTFQKGTKGDLWDPATERGIEVKGKMGRLVGIGKVSNGLDALDKLNAMFNLDIEFRTLSSSYLKAYVYPLIKDGISYTDAEKFIMTLSQHPETFLTHKNELIKRVHNGLRNKEELSNIFLATQILNYYDYSGFDDLLIFGDGKDENPKCKLFKINGASLDEIMEYGKIISYSGWGVGQELSIGVSIRKSDWLQIEISKYGRMTKSEREEYIKEFPEMLDYADELAQSIELAREKNREASRLLNEKIKADPARLEAHRQKQREQSAALKAKIYADPVLLAEYLKKQREQSAASKARLMADPVKWEAHKEKQREASRKRNLIKKTRLSQDI
jgi:hypothetical protein